MRGTLRSEAQTNFISPEPKPAVRGTIRAFWLNAFTITATIFMWLWIATGIVAGVVIANEASGSGSQPADQQGWNASWTDVGGYSCIYRETDSNDLCPSDPDYSN